MISLTNLNPADYLNELDHFAFDISIVGIVACFWIILLFGVSKKFKRIPHRITCCLVLSQLMGCVGVILWSTLGSQPGWQMYLQFSLFTIGNYSSRLWAALLAISLLFLQCRSLCFVLKLWPLFVSAVHFSWVNILIVNHFTGKRCLGSSNCTSYCTAPSWSNEHFDKWETQPKLSIWQRSSSRLYISFGDVLHW